MPEFDLHAEEKNLKSPFNIDEFISNHRYSLTFLVLGLALIGGGILFMKGDMFRGASKIEVLEETTEGQNADLELVVEVSGAVEKAGVYKLPGGSRVEDALIAAGGISGDADRNWIDKMVNRAAKLIDGQKIFIPKIGESNQQTLGVSAKNDGDSKVYQGGPPAGGGELVNINTASLNELDDLPGIGPVYGQSIIDHRPYSNMEELVSKGALKESVYEKVKDLVTVY